MDEDAVLLLLVLLQHAFCRSRSLAAIAFREVCRPWEAKLRRIFSRRDTGVSTVFVTTISAYRAGTTLMEMVDVWHSGCLGSIKINSNVARPGVLP